MKITPAILATIVDRPLSELTVLSLKDKEITHLDDISACVNLRNLDLTNNQIKSNDSLGGIRHLEDLVYLNLNNNKLETIDVIEYMSKLNVLNISNNQLATIPRSIAKCTDLRALVLAHNTIKRIENVGALTKLNTLVVSHNQLEDIPKMPKLGELKKISAAHNLLRIVPDLTSYPLLKELRLNDNKLTGVPEEIRQCSSLTVLDLGNNLLKDWVAVAALSSLMHLDNLNLKGNPVCELDGYRERILKMVPTLRILDGQRFDEKFLERKQKRKRHAEFMKQREEFRGKRREHGIK
ncbi:hypothetical protein FBU59_006996, partial [Linderina macrospora]